MCVCESVWVWVGRWGCINASLLLPHTLLEGLRCALHRPACPARCTALRQWAGRTCCCCLLRNSAMHAVAARCAGCGCGGMATLISPTLLSAGLLGHQGAEFLPEERGGAGGESR